MSYDFDLLRPDVCTDPARIQQHLETAGMHCTPEAETRNRELAALLQAENPALTSYPFDYEKIAEFMGVSVEEARRSHNHIELNGPENGNGIQILLFSEHASITVPYWHEGSKAAAIFDEIRRYADVLVKHGGYRIYDPQLERVVDDLNEVRDEILEQYGEVIQRLPEIAARALGPNKPWWKFW